MSLCSITYKYGSLVDLPCLVFTSLTIAGLCFSIEAGKIRDVGLPQMTHFSPQSAWTGVRPYLVIGKMAVLLLGSLVYLQLYESTRSLTPQKEQELGHAKPPG